MRHLDLGLVLAAAVLTSGCASTPMVGKIAPALLGSEWVLPAAARAPDLHATDWRVLAFFSPT